MVESKSQLFLIFHGRFPSEKAASLFAAKSCEIFSDAGLNVTLVVPKRLGRINSSPENYYGVKNNFQIKFLPAIDLFNFSLLKRVSFLVSLISFSITSLFFLSAQAKKDAIIYSNETLPLLLAGFIFPRTVYEMHDFPENRSWFYHLLFKRVGAIISTNRWKAQKLTEKFNISADKIFYEPNAVDVDKFNIKIPRNDLRIKLGLPADKKLIGYIGMLKTMGMGKGIDTALEALKILDNSFELILVGGNKEDIEQYKKIAEEMNIGNKVIFTGLIKHNQIPLYIRSFDVAIAPFPNSDHYNYYMSPMKIFEYMGGGAPIVASDLISIREILNEKNSILVKPEDPAEIASAILNITQNDELAEKLSREALISAADHTWQKRAERILKFIELIKK